MNPSLRRALITRTVIAAAVVFLIAALLLDGLVATGLRRQFDAGLADEAALLAATVEQTPQGVELDFGDLDMRAYATADGPGFMQLWRTDGISLYRSPSLAGADLATGSTTVDQPEFAGITLPAGHDGRRLTMVFRPRLESVDDAPDAEAAADAPGLLKLVLARDATELARSLARFRLALAAVMLVALVMVAATLAMVVRGALRPVETLAGQIGRLDATDLGVRLPHAGVPGEIRPVVTRLNDLLERLQAAFERERTFSADVAHELRTPLAGLRTCLEVAARRERTGDEYRATLAECLESSRHLQDLVTRLLQLARLDAGAIEIARRPVAVADLLREVWKPLVAAAESRGLVVAWETDATPLLNTDPDLLRLAVRNLLDNAVHYADQGGRIGIRLHADSGSVEIAVVNSGCRVARDEIDGLRDRFRRGDSARSGTGEHAGLGLTVVGSIAGALGGTLRLQGAAGGDFTAVLAIPAGA